MGSWHRENPELCGTNADPWMQHPGHRAAYRELRDAGLIFVDGDDQEACEAAADDLEALSRAALTPAPESEQEG